MHPKAKMSGGPEYPTRVEQEAHNRRVSRYLERFTDPGKTNPHYIDSSMWDKVAGEIDNGLEQSQRD